MPDKINRPQEPSDVLYHDAICGEIARVEEATRETPEPPREIPSLAARGVMAVGAAKLKMT